MTKLKFFYLLLIPLAGIILYTNYKVDAVTRLSSGTVMTSSNTTLNNKTKAPGNLTVADPQEYGITKQESDALRTPDEWSSDMNQTLSEQLVVEVMDQQGILEDLQKNPQKIEEKFRRVKEEIGQQEIRVRQHPQNADEESRLQSLYMLKAMLTTLREKIAPAHPNQQ